LELLRVAAIIVAIRELVSAVFLLSDIVICLEPVEDRGREDYLVRMTE
jgi:hypothetical protein